MVPARFWRGLHITNVLLFDNVGKSPLAALRKKTGYTFANCKKALEMFNNDIALAEKWLNEQAQSMGWSKATKLAERITTQGLVGVLIRGNIGAMVEINCETDFVARNENFRAFVDHVCRVCALYTELTQFDGDMWKSGFELDSLKNLKAPDGRSLMDHLALFIGTVGENTVMRRAICFKVNNDLKLCGYAHPQATSTASSQNITQLGKYGTIVTFHSQKQNHIDEELQKNLCQHIVGLNPKIIGEMGKNEPHPNKDEEACLIHQEYLLDEDKTVGEVLLNNNIQLIDYERYECGEIISNTELDKMEVTK